MKEQKWLNLYHYILGHSLSSVTQLFIKRLKNNNFFLKRNTFVLVSAGAKAAYKTARAQALESKSLQLFRN